MSNKEHLLKHKQLHQSLGELFADFISHTDEDGESSIHKLIEWSYKQTQNINHKSE